MGQSLSNAFLQLPPKMLKSYFNMQARAARRQLKLPRPVTRGMSLVGHRGASALEPENTMAALLRAWVDGAEGAEFDLQQLSDGTLVVLHDETLRRTAAPNPSKTDAGKQLEYEALLDTDVQNLTWDHVRDVDVGGECMVRYEDVLRELSYRSESEYVFAELKDSSGPEMVNEVIRVTQQENPRPSQVVFISFNPEICKKVKECLPAYDVLFLNTCITEAAALETIQEAKSLGATGVDLFADPRVVTRRVCEAAHKEGLLVAVWALRFPAANDFEFVWSQMHENGVDMFTSNLPKDAFSWAKRTGAMNGFQEFWADRHSQQAVKN